MSDADKELIFKTEKLTLNSQINNQQGTNELNDLDDITPNRGRFFSSMNYKEYVIKFDKPPARPQLMPLQADPLSENDFSLDSAEQNTEMRSYSQSVPMRPFELSGSSSLKSNLDQKTIEEEDEEEEVGGIVDDPIYPLESLPKSNNLVNNIMQNNEFIRNRSQSENYTNFSIFNFCQSGRSKQNSIVN